MSNCFLLPAQLRQHHDMADNTIATTKPETPWTFLNVITEPRNYIYKIVEEHTQEDTIPSLTYRYHPSSTSLQLVSKRLATYKDAVLGGTSGRGY